MANVWSEWGYLRLGRPRRGQSPVEHREPERVRWLSEKIWDLRGLIRGLLGLMRANLRPERA